MCGRIYATYTDEELSLRYLNGRPIEITSPSANYNGAPTQKFPILRFVNEERHFDLMHWQLIPRWETEFKTKLSTINAKSETVFESKLYHSLILKQRCILPVTGFFEWQSPESPEKPTGQKLPKKPFAIHGKQQKILSLAGIWDRWGGPAGQLSFSILTTRANSLMAPMHDRMPVILGPEEEEAWLDPKRETSKEIVKLLKPCPSGWLDAYEVSTAVNSPRNNRAEIIEPLT